MAWYSAIWHGMVFCDMASLSERQNLGKFPPWRFGRTDTADTIPLKRNVWNVLSKNGIYCEYQMNRLLRKDITAAFELQK